MTITDFSTVATNINVTLPVFEIKPGVKRTGDAAKAFPGDRFIAYLDEPLCSEDYDDDAKMQCWKLNSRGKPETDEDHELMPTWDLPINQLEYKGEIQIPLQMFNALAY